MTGFFPAFALHFFVISVSISGSVPNCMAPCFTLGHDTFISNIETLLSSESLSSTASYSSSLWPHTFTITGTSKASRNPRSRSIKTSTPGFCRPIAFIIPDGVSVTLGVGLPSQGLSDTPFVVTAPSLPRSTNPEYSIPEPKVPDAVVMGFFSVYPANSTVRSIISLPLMLRRPALPYRSWHYGHCCAGPFPLF